MKKQEKTFRILIIRFSSIGDIVLTSPVTRHLRKIYPKAELDYLTKTEYAPLAQALPGFDHVVSFEIPNGIWALSARLRRKSYDLVVDLHGSIRSRLVTLLTNGNQVVRYNKQRVARIALIASNRNKRSWEINHTVDRYLDIINKLGDGEILPIAKTYLSEIDRLPQLIVKKSISIEIMNSLTKAGIKSESSIVGIAPSASHSTKRWRPDYFAIVADYLVEVHGMTILLLGGADDSIVTKKVVSAMKTSALNWFGRTNLLQLAAAIKQCRILISNDSGPMHIATAVGTPALGIFGSTHPQLGFAPLGPQDTMVSLNLPCSPCSLHGDRVCRFGTQACLEDLSPQHIINEIENRYFA